MNKSNAEYKEVKNRKYEKVDFILIRDGAISNGSVHPYSRPQTPAGFEIFNNIKKNYCT